MRVLPGRPAAPWGREREKPFPVFCALCIGMPPACLSKIALRFRTQLFRAIDDLWSLSHTPIYFATVWNALSAESVLRCELSRYGKPIEFFFPEFVEVMTARVQERMAKAKPPYTDSYAYKLTKVTTGGALLKDESVFLAELENTRNVLGKIEDQLSKSEFGEVFLSRGIVFKS